jgi:hypothetical protein
MDRIYTQGFSAAIPPSYLKQLQNIAGLASSPIDYIGQPSVAL